MTDMGKYYYYFILNSVPPYILIGVIASNPCVIYGILYWQRATSSENAID